MSLSMSLHLYCVPQEVIDLAIKGSASEAEQIIETRQLEISVDIAKATLTGQDVSHLIRLPVEPLHSLDTPDFEDEESDEDVQIVKEEQKPKVPKFVDEDDLQDLEWDCPGKPVTDGVVIEKVEELQKETLPTKICLNNLDEKQDLQFTSKSRRKTNSEKSLRKVFNGESGDGNSLNGSTLLSSSGPRSSTSRKRNAKPSARKRPGPKSKTSPKKKEAGDEKEIDDENDLLDLDEDLADLSGDLTEEYTDEDESEKKKDPKTKSEKEKERKETKDDQEDSVARKSQSDDDDDLMESPFQKTNPMKDDESNILFPLKPTSLRPEDLQDDDEEVLQTQKKDIEEVKKDTKKEVDKKDDEKECKPGPSGISRNSFNSTKTNGFKENSSPEDDDDEVRKPKKKRKKYIESDSDVESESFELSDDPLCISDEDDEDEDKPKRKRVTRSSKKEDHHEVLDISDEDEEEDSKKKRTSRRKRSQKSEEEEKSDSDDDKKSSKKQPERNAWKKLFNKKDKKPKRKRIKKPVDSDETDEKQDESDCEVIDSNSPGKRHRKIIQDKNLTQDTKAANQRERERLERIEKMQRMYNELDKFSPQKNDKPTRLVLEYDEKSKKPVVEVDPVLVPLLKPHQLEGIKFLYTSVIESVKRLESDTGSGCILAHSMGLGKTLQVITFTHTLLTHPRINDDIGRILVVCPKNTCRNWASEYNAWLFDRGLSLGAKARVDDFDTYKSLQERQQALRKWQNNRGVMIIGDTLMSRLVLEASPDAVKKKKKTKKSVLSDNFYKAIRECLCDPGADMVIVDEGHKIKNDSSQLNRALSMLRTARRIILTGTPLQNNLSEYHVMVDFVKPSLLGTKKEFHNRFINPITSGQHEDSSPQEVRLMKKRTHVLHKLLEGCVQRHDYRILAPYLHPKHEYVLKVKLTDVQAQIYQHYLDHFSGKKNVGVKGNGSKGYLFNDCCVFRLICAHPRLLETVAEKERERRLEEDFLNDESESSTPSEASDDIEILEKNGVAPKAPASRRKTRSMKKGDIPDEPALPTEVDWFQQYMPPFDDQKTDVKEAVSIGSKINLFFEILEMCERIGDKLIVFSQSIPTLDMIEYFLEQVNRVSFSHQRETDDLRNTWVPGFDYFRIDGTSSSDNRKAHINKFNDESNPRARLFLISTRAGCLGINLVGANRCIIFDASWNPTNDVQAIFRIYRFGQKKPIYVYRFVSYGTMEERIYERQVIKQALACRVVDEQQIDRHFKEDELAELYRFQPEPETDQTPLVPKDKLLADILSGDKTKKIIVNYHEHDSLLEERPEENLTEEDRKEAWEEYEKEKEQRSQPYIQPQTLSMSNEEWQEMLRQQFLRQQQPQNIQPKTILDMTFATLVILIKQTLPPNATQDMICKEVDHYLNRNLQKVQSELEEYLVKVQTADVASFVDARRKDISHLQTLKNQVQWTLNYCDQMQQKKNEEYNRRMEHIRQQQRQTEQQIMQQISNEFTEQVD